jgi:hypothetical protein
MSLLLPRSYFGVSARDNIHVTKQEELSKMRGQGRLVNGNQTGVVRDNSEKNKRLERSSSHVKKDGAHLTQRGEGLLGLYKTEYGRQCAAGDATPRVPGPATDRSARHDIYAAVRGVPSSSTSRNRSFDNSGLGMRQTKGANFQRSGKALLRSGYSSTRS